MENRRILTKYQPLGGNDSAQDECPESIFIDKDNAFDDPSWSHTNDLDVFFKNVYLYHKDGGFYCKLGSKVFEVVQVAYITALTIVVCIFIDYPILFRDVAPDGEDEIPTKLYLHDVFKSWDDAKNDFNRYYIFFIISSIVFTLFKLGQTIASVPLYYKIKKFYEHGLKINDNEMDVYTWDEVKDRIIKLQKEQQFCIQKEELNELDIHHRILRFTNYFVGMVNHNVIDLNLHVPVVGEVTYLSRGLKYNLDLALFWGPFSPFASNWRLKDDFKRPDKLHENADKMRKTFKLLALINFVFMAFILFWQVLYFFYSCAQFMKNEYFKSHQWSLFGEVYLRHFNELDHELQLRLNKAFNPSLTYVKTFPTKRFTAIVSHLSFLVGAPFIIIAGLTAWSAEVMQVEHVITILTVLGVATKYFFDVMPSEAFVQDPEKHLKHVLYYTRYAPEHWTNKAHTPRVKQEFSKLFEHKAVHIFEDFISPIITPYILWCKLPNNARQISEFLRKYTIEVEGVGDVCSFSHLKTYTRHNLRQASELLESSWIDSNTMRSFNRAETSLVGFALNNRNWNPPEDSANFIADLRKRSQNERAARSVLHNTFDRFFPTVSDLQPSQRDQQEHELLAEQGMFESLRNKQRDENDRINDAPAPRVASQGPSNLQLTLASSNSSQSSLFMPEVRPMN